MGARLFNVAAPVVALITADTAEQAERILARQLERAGFYIYAGEVTGVHAFESEPVD